MGNFYVPGTVLGSGDTLMNSGRKVLVMDDRLKYISKRLHMHCQEIIRKVNWSKMCGRREASVLRCHWSRDRK